jgi:hypothetical protein
MRLSVFLFLVFLLLLILVIALVSFLLRFVISSRNVSFIDTCDQRSNLHRLLSLYNELIGIKGGVYLLFDIFLVEISSRVYD